jgi:hypothetical protein
VFKDIIQTICQQRYNLIKKPYLSIHVRHTDHKSNFEQLYYENKTLIDNYDTIFLATDNETVLQFFKSKHINIINFTTFGILNMPLHDTNNNINNDNLFIDTICDIFLASLSDVFLSNSIGGYSILIKLCHQYKDITKNQIKLDIDTV